jgi:hypothetical protein
MSFNAAVVLMVMHTVCTTSYLIVVKAVNYIAAYALFFLVRLLPSDLTLQISLSPVLETTVRDGYGDLRDPVESIQYVESQIWLR